MSMVLRTHPAFPDYLHLYCLQTMSVVALGKAVRADSRLAFCAQGDYHGDQSIAFSSPEPASAAKEVRRAGAWKALGCYRYVAVGMLVSEC